MSLPYTSATSIIKSYRTQYAPYTKSKQWKSRIQELAWDLAEARGRFWNLDIELEEHYVYVYLDPRKPGQYSYALPSGRLVRFPYQPFYVGKGKGNRSKIHGASCMLKLMSHKNNTIKAIRKLGLREIVVQSTDMRNVDDWTAQAYEIDLIAGIGRRNLGEGPLTNLTDGGEGTTGKVVSELTRNKIGAAHKGKTWTAEQRANWKPVEFTPSGLERLAEAARTRIWTQEMRDSVSKGRKGKKHSAEAKLKMSRAHKGKILSEEHRAKLRTCNRNISDDARRKMSIAASKPKSEETKAKMRAAALAREAAKKNSITNKHYTS